MSDGFIPVFAICAVIVGGALLLTLDHFVRKALATRRRTLNERADQKAIAARKAEVEAAWPEQKRLGDILLAMVTAAARENTNLDGGHRFDGEINIRTLVVRTFEHNAGAYSVIVDLREGGRYCVNVAQFNIYPDRLNWAYGPYGPVEELPTAYFDGLAEKACERVRTFK